MKKPKISPAALFLVSVIAASISAPSVQAQTYAEDTLAVRVLLDENGLTTVSALQVTQKDTSQRVTVLDLSSRQLVSMTSELGTLTGLKSLVLSNNLLDSLPAELWSLDRLNSLDVSGNKIGRLDARIGQLKNLVFLGFSDNGVSALPAQLFTLEQLETLLLDRNTLDTLSDSVANLIFLKYLDFSGNTLQSAPSTLAIMGLDSLDLSGNILTSLPEVFTEMSPSTRVRLTDNRLCDMSPELESWATGKDPVWKAAQTCGAAVRPGAVRKSGPLLRAFSTEGGLRLDFPGLGNRPGTYEAVLRDASGRAVFRSALSRSSLATGLHITREEAGRASGFLWAELRSTSGAGPLAAVPVLLSR